MFVLSHQAPNWSLAFRRNSKHIRGGCDSTKVTVVDIPRGSSNFCIAINWNIWGVRVHIQIIAATRTLRRTAKHLQHRGEGKIVLTGRVQESYV